MPEGDLDKDPLPGIDHAPFLERCQEALCLLVGNGIPHYFFYMVDSFLRNIVTEPEYPDISMAASLAFHDIASLGGKTASEDVIDLAGHTSEDFGQLLSPERHGLFVHLGKKVVDIVFNDSRQTRHGTSLQT
ncbi:hypothetical protein SDC9_198918 [bioreactor metagenome]|uniref:Uncharacterized protein n=1 Tax=bioreactor metagenome TaxID=1076179 RepID=A0A645IJ07_9ZZZZ